MFKIFKSMQINVNKFFTLGWLTLKVLDQLSQPTVLCFEGIILFLKKNII